MNRDESQRVIDRLTAGWLHVDMSPESARVWMSVLDKIPFESAAAAVDALIESENFFPTIAKFRSALGSQRRSERHQWTGAKICDQCEGTGLVTDAEGRDWTCQCAGFALVAVLEPEVSVPPAELIAKTRDLLGRMGRGHNHKGPNPCPVCGGMALT